MLLNLAKGVIDIEINCEIYNGIFLPISATIKRTARRIMDGHVYIQQY